MNKITNLDKLIESIDNSKIILIGDQTHGTEEFYDVRIDITKKLIYNKKINFITIEWDLIDVYNINLFILDKTNIGLKKILDGFKRFPKWLWNNKPFHNFIIWLKEYNKHLEYTDKIRIYGIDFYCMFDTFDILLDYIYNYDLSIYNNGKYIYNNLIKYKNREFDYGKDIEINKIISYEKDITNFINSINDYLQNIDNIDEYIFIKQNLRLLKDIENYYRQSINKENLSWNLRDLYMFNTINNLIKPIKNYNIIIWTHNSHVADGRYIDDYIEMEQYNLSQLLKQYYGTNFVYTIGMLTYMGNIIASTKWNGNSLTMKLSKANIDSYEFLLNKLSINYYIILKNNNIFFEKKIQRFIGVIYDKYNEFYSHYVKGSINLQYDSIIFINNTNKLIHNSN